MVDTVWIAFGCGLLIGSMFGILCLGLVSINRDNKHRDELEIANGRVADLELQRKLLKNGEELEGADVVKEKSF